MLESDLEKQVVEWVEAHGGVCLKVKIDGKRGFPDRLIVFDKVVCFVELKRPNGGGKVSPHQTSWIQKLDSYKHPAFVCESLEDFIFTMFYWGIV